MDTLVVARFRVMPGVDADLARRRIDGAVRELARSAAVPVVSAGVVQPGGAAQCFASVTTAVEHVIHPMHPSGGIEQFQEEDR